MHNGTRQGSILSPYLFSVYMRDVSIELLSTVVLDAILETCLVTYCCMLMTL
jgi:hypothetical protein